MTKETIIKFRIEKNEKERLEKKAKSIGISLSDYLRQLCVFGDVRKIPDSAIIDIRRIGINVNQIAKRVNGGSITKDKVIADLQEIISDLEKLNIR